MQAIITEAERRGRLDRRAGNSLRIAKSLEAAMQLGEIQVLFQPLFSATSGRLIGAEALSRWNHPDLGTVGAEALFGVATRAEYLRQLTQHVIRTALEAASRWDSDLRLSVNIAAADLANRAFPDALHAVLEETGFSADRLTLEITEQSLVEEIELSAERLTSLAGLGINIALDDFGTGFCNFRYLQRLPLHSLKFDRSLVEGIDSNPRDLAILRGMLAMAAALDLSVVAEGIERVEQLEVVMREGCSAWQGYLGAKPLTTAQFAEFATSFTPRPFHALPLS